MSAVPRGTPASAAFTWPQSDLAGEGVPQYPIPAADAAPLKAVLVPYGAPQPPAYALGVQLRPRRTTADLPAYATPGGDRVGAEVIHPYPDGADPVALVGHT